MNNNLKEKTTHGDFILPFTTYTGEINDTFALIPMHWHDEIEITLNEYGKCNYSIDLNNYSSNDGDIFIIKPLILHSMKKTNNSNTKWSTMVFNLNMLKSAQTDGCLIKYLAPIINNEHELPILIQKTSNGYDEILLNIKSIFDCYSQKNEAFELELKSLLFHLIALFYKYNLIIKNKNKDNLPLDVTDKIKTILNYVRKNYQEHITVEELAKLCNFSEYYFMKFFKKHIGMTSLEYINHYRLEIASDLLKRTDKSIMDISLDVGFNSVSYFTKLFKTKYKVTPKEFRK